MPQKQKGKVTEIMDTSVHPNPSEEISSSDSEQEVIQDVTSAPSTSQKKKKKKTSKIAKLLGGGKDEIPRELVNRVLDQVKGDSAAVGTENINAENVREALEQLKIMDVVRGKAGLGGLNKKDMGEHKVR
jgi:glycylpeptide N-tetradecanoyltransferase